MLQIIYELRKNWRGRVDREIEGSTRGPRGPKKLNGMPVRVWCQSKEVKSATKVMCVTSKERQNLHFRRTGMWHELSLTNDHP